MNTTTKAIKKSTEDVIAKAKHDGLRAEIIAAYQMYSERKPGSMDYLLKKARELAYRKVYKLEYDFRQMGSAETADDWAQEVTIAVWQGLEKFKGSGEQFYAWVCKIAFNERINAAEKLKEQRDTMVGLTVPSTGEDDEYEVDNPEMYRNGACEIPVHIPEDVKGLDLDICNEMLVPIKYWNESEQRYRMRARTYAEISKELNVNEKEVRNRVHRIRTRIGAQEKRKKAKRANLERIAAENRRGKRR